MKTLIKKGIPIELIKLELTFVRQKQAVCRYENEI